MSQFFHPRLTALRALSPPTLQTTWSTGERLEVDLGRLLSKIPALRPLAAPEVFAKARLRKTLQAVEWFDAELGADNLYALAKEQAGEASHQMFDAWMRRHGLSLQTAADALGLSRRMVSYYRTAQKRIPRTVWLACLGREATRPGSGALPKGVNPEA